MPIPVRMPRRVPMPILMYHSVCPDDVVPPSRFVVRRQTFARHLAWLAEHGYQTVSEIDVASRSPDQARRTVMLTFDDGYADNHDVVLPLLLRHGFSAIVFAVADFTRRRAWWDPAVPAGASLLTPAQLRTMAAHGIRMGAHGMTHQRMDRLSASARRAELLASRHALEDVLGAAVVELAWPYGAVDAGCKRDAAEAGYRAAFAVHSGPLLLHDAYEIRRTFMGDRAGGAYMRAKVQGIDAAARWVGWTLRRARPVAPTHTNLEDIVSARAPGGAPR